MPKTTSPIDVLVGHNIYQFRRMAGFSQKVLSESLGVSFQQLQKYEKGTNRITVGKLVEVAHVLNVSVQDLLIGAEDVRAGAENRESPANLKLARRFENIENSEVRRAIGGLINAITRECDPAEEPPEHGALP